MNREKSSIGSLVCYPFFPFFAFINACRNLKNKCNGIVFILFFGLFGYTHTFTDIRADSYRKFWDFNSFSINNFSEIWDQYTHGYIKDIYEGFLFVCLKSWTDDPHIMMMAVGLVGGLFIWLTLRRIICDSSVKYSWCIYILILFAMMRFNPVSMGGIRNFTALSIFTYSAIRFLVDKNNKWFWGLLICPLIHFSFIVYIAGVIFIRFVCIPKTVLFWAVIVACTASVFLNTGTWSKVIESATTYVSNESMSNRIEHYADEDTEEHFSASLTTQILRIQNKIGAFFVIAFLFYVKRNWKKLNIDKYTDRLYRLLLFWLFFGYLFISFSVVGQRYLPFGMILLYFFMLNLYIRNKNSGIKWFIYSMPVVFIGNIAWFIYNCYCNTLLALYYAPLPVLLFAV